MGDVQYRSLLHISHIQCTCNNYYFCTQVQSIKRTNISMSCQARLQRANTLLRLGKLGEAEKDFEFLAESASGSVKEDAHVQVSERTHN